MYPFLFIFMFHIYNSWLPLVAADPFYQRTLSCFCAFLYKMYFFVHFLFVSYFILFFSCCSLFRLILFTNAQFLACVFVKLYSFLHFLFVSYLWFLAAFYSVRFCKNCILCVHFFVCFIFNSLHFLRHFVATDLFLPRHTFLCPFL